MLKTLTSLTLFIASFCLATPSLMAANANSGRWYQVEMVLFKNYAAGSNQDEEFKAQPQVVWPGKMQRLKPVAANSVDQPSAFAALQKSELVLTQQVAQMKRNSSFSVLQHIGWRQPIYGKSQHIQFSFGPYYGKQASIQGFISLSIDRYIHARAQFDYLKFAKSTAFADNPNSGFEITKAAFLKQYRKTVSKKIMLMDHPEYSILLFFTPMEDLQAGKEITIL